MDNNVILKDCQHKKLITYDYFSWRDKLAPPVTLKEYRNLEVYGFKIEEANQNQRKNMTVFHYCEDNWGSSNTFREGMVESGFGI